MADSRQQIIGEINAEIQSAVDSFNNAIPQMEKSLVRKINLIIKDLDLNPDGTIKSTIANMKKMRTIEREMAVAFESAQYLGNVEKYTNAYDKTRAIEGKYFDKVLTDYSEPAIMNEIQNQAVSTVTKELTGSNIVANVIDPVNTLVRQGIESGMEWDDLRSSIGDFLQGVDGGVGALDRYTTTITNDALNTYARTYENTIANREGIEWYEYVGREMTNTRDFCSTLDAQRWFHQSEIKGFLKGRIGKRSVPLYRKTGKPYGMKSSTTEKNFVQLAGGWNCGHHAYPVPTHLVPQKVRDKFETGVDAVDVDDALDVDDFVPATSIKEAEQFARDKGLAKNVNYKGFSLESTNAINKSLIGLKSRTNMPPLQNIGEFKMVRDLRIADKISKRSRQQIVGQYSYLSDYGSVKVDREVMIFNKKRMGTLSDADATFDALKETKQVHDMDFDGMVAHEYAHFIEAHNRVGEWESMSNKMWKDVVVKKYPDEFDMDFFKQSVRDKVGSYALANDTEFFAEMFRLKYTNKLPNEFDFIGEWFDKNILK